MSMVYFVSSSFNLHVWYIAKKKQTKLNFFYIYLLGLTWINVNLHERDL